MGMDNRKDSVRERRKSFPLHPGGAALTRMASLLRYDGIRSHIHTDTQRSHHELTVGPLSRVSPCQLRRNRDVLRGHGSADLDGL